MLPLSDTMPSAFRVAFNSPTSPPRLKFTLSEFARQLLANAPTLLGVPEPREDGGCLDPWPDAGRERKLIRLEALPRIHLGGSAADRARAPAIDGTSSERELRPDTFFGAITDMSSRGRFHLPDDQATPR
ncbi:hypothetical protein MRX96_002455 [Rhipicephalus microplus]